MTADVLLQRLEGVRQVAASRWRACCPAHQGRNRNVLSIAEAGDGTTLLKCFAGCTAQQVVDAVGLELHDLFPNTATTTREHHTQPARRPRPDWPAAILACERDLLVVMILLEQLARGAPIVADDQAAANAAAARVWRLIQEARSD